jgi:hypothetical protein
VGMSQPGDHLNELRLDRIRLNFDHITGSLSNMECGVRDEDIAGCMAVCCISIFGMALAATRI